MNSLGNQFFAGAALAGHQNGRARRRHLFNNAKDLLHDVGPADDRAAIDLAAHRLSQGTAFFFLSPSLYARGNGRQDMFVLKRLADAI